MRKVLMTILLSWASVAQASLQPVEAESPAIHPAKTQAVDDIRNNCLKQAEARPILLFVRTDDGRLRLVGIVSMVPPTC